MANMTVVSDPGRHSKYDFSVLKRDEFETLARAEVVGRDTMRIGLPQLIVPDFLFQTGSYGHQRSYPVRLLALNFSDPGKPVYEVILNCGPKPRDVLRPARCRRGEHKSCQDKSDEEGADCGDIRNSESHGTDECHVTSVLTSITAIQKPARFPSTVPLRQI